MLRFFDYSFHIMIDFAALALLYFGVFFLFWRKREKSMLLLNTIMFIYISLVIYVTLMPVICYLPYIFDHPYVPMSMVPFEDYLMGRVDAERQIILNVLMMVPLGFLLPMYKKRNPLFNALLVIFAAFSFSLFIELFQPLINASRSADITDVITNTTGGFLGFILYSVLSAAKSLVIRK